MIHLYYFLHECRPTEADLLVLFSPERCATPSGDQADLLVLFSLSRVRCVIIPIGVRRDAASVRRPRPASVRPSVRPSVRAVCWFLCPSVASVLPSCLD